ncbi:hypothetical protein [Chitinophaga alhagiae]|uniref:hypothetical protein n=1 Tax=Chitinophaga alhagiae TaxID=2203219 RepID=UPI001300A4FC|nr:hypothetical protein [Chitinophaga alhagiae]
MSLAVMTGNALKTAHACLPSNSYQINNDKLLFPPFSECSLNSSLTQHPGCN